MTTQPGAMLVHPYEAAGLGKAPFFVVGVEERRGPITIRTSDGIETQVGAPGQPMGSCQFCGTGIAECWSIRSADGKQFIVGCECVRKVAAKGSPLRTEFEKHLCERKRKKDAARLLNRTVAARVAWTADSGLLADRKHSNPYMANSRGLTARDEADFLLSCGGGAGQTRACWMIERAAEEKNSVRA